MKTRKLIKETGMRTGISIREMSCIVVKRVSCSILWIGNRYAVYSANSRNEKYSRSNSGLGAHHSSGLSSCSCGARRRTAKPPGHHRRGCHRHKACFQWLGAYIILRAGARLTEEQVMARAEERLAKYKRLECGVKLIQYRRMPVARF